MKIFLDMDGVLVDFVGGACRAHRVPNPWRGGANAGTWDMVELLGMKVGEFWQPMQNHVFWASLGATPECDSVVQLCENAVGSANVCLLTSPCRGGGSASGKMAWIERRLPDYDRRFLIGPPKHFCAHPGVLLIDDNDANVQAFRDAGGKAILYPRPWNSRHDAECLLSDELHSIIRGPIHAK